MNSGIRMEVSRSLDLSKPADDGFLGAIVDGSRSAGWERFSRYGHSRTCRQRFVFYQD